MRKRKPDPGAIAKIFCPKFATVCFAILYVIGLLAAGWLLGGPTLETRKLMTLATAGRNFGAAFVPAAASFPDPKVEVALIVNAIVGLVLLFLAAAWLRRKT